MKLDAGRTRELRVFTPAELREIGVATIRALSDLLDELDIALAGPDLAAAANVAHRARNEALLVGAREMCDAFDQLERAARDIQVAHTRASEAAASARRLWPETRSAIAELARGDHEV